MKQGNSIASRHPTVLFLHEHNTPTGAVNIASEFIEEFRVFKMPTDAINAVRDCKPKIILLETDMLEDSVKFYIKLIKQHKLLNYPHFVILICSKNEVQAAHSLCAQGAFFDYFVSRPIYQKFRLISILNRACKKINAADKLISINDSHCQLLNGNLTQLIQDIQATHNQITEPLSDKLIAPSERHDSKANTVEQLKAIITPLVNEFGDELKDKLNQALSQLNSIQSNILEHTQDINETLNENMQQVDVDDLLTLTQKEISRITEIEEDVLAQKLTAETSDDLLFSDQVEPEELNKITKILLVEDNHIYRDMVKRILQSSDYSVDVAADGLEAIYKIKKTKYDLVLMDLFMPKLDGLNATKQFRKFSGKKDLPIIALTGNKDKEIVHKWASAGINAYIMKPSNKEKILKTVKNCLVKHYQ
ncbi:response regulator [Catenovulum maritimum]|uniref:response regulator n=1 Tax=Catenovulum maritimum TaxID=1513271 RepID=UPI000660F92F|nr:response regulator [Catenovulum maritimum]